MNKQQLKEIRKNKIDNIQQALNILDDAAEESSQEIRNIINRDYQDLMTTFSGWDQQGKTLMRDLGDTVNSAVNTSKETFQNIDSKVHKNPWNFIGGAALSSIAIGYLWGKYTSKNEHPPRPPQIH